LPYLYWNGLCVKLFSYYFIIKMKKFKLLFLFLILISQLDAQTYEIAEQHLRIALDANKVKEWKIAAESFEKAVIAEENCIKPRLKRISIPSYLAASNYAKIKEYDKALPLFLQAITVEGIEFGKESFEYFRILEGLINLYEETDRSLKAIPHYLEALEIIKKV